MSSREPMQPHLDVISLAASVRQDDRVNSAAEMAKQTLAGRRTPQKETRRDPVEKRIDPLGSLGLLPEDLSIGRAHLANQFRPCAQIVRKSFPPEWLVGVGDRWMAKQGKARPNEPVGLSESGRA